MGEAASMAVKITKEDKGISAARELYEALLKLPAAGGSLFHTILDLELAEEQNRLPRSRQTALFEVHKTGLQQQRGDFLGGWVGGATLFVQDLTDSSAQAMNVGMAGQRI
jgi:hypothetical protein